MRIPKAVDVERAVLGSLIVDTSATWNSIGNLPVEAFFLTANQTIYRAIRDVSGSEQRQVDAVAVVEHLRSAGDLDKVGGVMAIADLDGRPWMARKHAETLRDRLSRRKLILESENLKAAAYDMETPTAQIAQEAAQRISDSAEPGGDTVTIQEVLRRIDEGVRAFRSGISKPRGVTSGISKIDNWLTYRGWPLKHVTCIGGESSHGKSAFVSTVLTNAAMSGIPCIDVTLEDDPEARVCRNIARLSGLDNGMVQRGEIAKDDDQRYLNAIRTLAKTNITFIGDERLPSTVGDMVALIRREVRRTGARLVVVDYLQLAKSGKFIQKKQDETDYVFDALVQMARSLPKTATLVVSQLRDVGGAMPYMDDLYHSRAISQWAHTVCLVWRPKPLRDMPFAIINIDKQKNGKIAHAVVGWDDARVAFSDVPPDMENYAEEYRRKAMEIKDGKKKW